MTRLRPSSQPSRRNALLKEFCLELMGAEGYQPDPGLPRLLRLCTRSGQPFHPRLIQCACAAVLGAAELPAHSTPHCLRHTFASLLLSDGVSPAYVQRMLGHSSIKLTVDLYGTMAPDGQQGGGGPPRRPGRERSGSRGGSKRAGRRPRREPAVSLFAGFGASGDGVSRRRASSATRGTRRRAGPAALPEETRWYSSRSSRCLPVSVRGTSTTTV